MSDFLFTSRSVAPGALGRCLHAYLAAVSPEIDEVTGPWGTLAVARRQGAASPLHRDAAGCSVLVGEPLLDVGTGPGRADSGGRRAALHALLLRDEPTDWARCLDGMAAALGVRPDGSIRLVTDRFGFVPVYQAGGDRGWMAGTHPDALARAAGLEHDWDPVSLADQLVHLTCTFPFTPYSGVRQVAPGVEAGLGGVQQRVHWRPREANPFPDLREAAGELRSAVADDLRLACGGLPEAGILLSGGEDSRALLGAMPPVPVRAFTFAGRMNREARVARAVAAAYGAQFALGRRDESHYEAGMPRVAALVGSMHLFMDVHGYGLHRRLGLDRLPVVVGGLSADSLLKGEYAAIGARAVRGPEAPGVRPELLEAVAERRAGFVEWLREIRPRTAEEWSVLWPFSMRRHGGNVHGNRRLFAAHEAYHANRVLEVAAAAPVAWKRDRRLFVAAMRPFLRRSWYVPHARSRFPYLGRGPNLLLGALLRAGRAVRDLATGEILRRQGGWPRWSEVSGSPAVEEAWVRYPVEESALAGLFAKGTAPDAMRRALRGVHPLRQMMALQLVHLTGPARPWGDGA